MNIARLLVLFVECLAPFYGIPITIRLIEKLRTVESFQVITDENMNR